jgi:hypothetical protein
MTEACECHRPETAHQCSLENDCSGQETFWMAAAFLQGTACNHIEKEHDPYAVVLPCTVECIDEDECSVRVAADAQLRTKVIALTSSVAEVLKLHVCFAGMCKVAGDKALHSTQPLSAQRFVVFGRKEGYPPRNS